MKNPQRKTKQNYSEALAEEMNTALPCDSMGVSLSKERLAICFALIAAAGAAFSPPLSKLALEQVSPFFTASLLNIGSGIGVICASLLLWKTPMMDKSRHIRKADTPWLLGIIFSDMLAAMSMMLGLSLTAASNASLLSNFETVATAFIALIVFKELISRRLWFAILFVTAGSMILSVEDFSSFSISPGSLLVIAACVFWGFENNFMRKVSERNPTEVVTVKGIFAGLGSLIIAFAVGEPVPSLSLVIMVLVLGVFIYGINNVFLLLSQRHLGAARAGTFYGINPFLAALVSCIIFSELPSWQFIFAFVLMGLGIFFATLRGFSRRVEHG